MERREGKGEKDGDDRYIRKRERTLVKMEDEIATKNYVCVCLDESSNVQAMRDGNRWLMVDVMRGKERSSFQGQSSSGSSSDQTEPGQRIIAKDVRDFG